MTDMAKLIADIKGGLVACMSAEEQDDLVQKAKDDVGAPFEDAVTDRLATMRLQNPSEYMRLRERLKSVKVGVTELERVLDTKMGKAGNFDDLSGGQGRAISFKTVERWSEPVDGKVLVAELVGQIEKHVCLSREAAIAVALWIIHTYCFDLFPISPRLVISSPEKRCGKTTLLRVISMLVARRLSATNITAAAMFRTIERYHPTLLIDEADTFLKDNEELRGVINSGHASDGAIIRTVGDNHEPMSFSTYAPVAIAAIGELQGTIEDHAVKVAMRRKLTNEVVERFRMDRVHDLDVLARRIVRFISDEAEALSNVDPTMPLGLNDRACDNWFSLLSIADAAGGEWPILAREAAVVLSAEGTDEDGSYSVKLLADIRRIFIMAPDICISSTDLAQRLVDLPDRPWAIYSRGRPLTPNALARRLRSFGISPQTIKTSDGHQPNGYRWVQFVDACNRYLPDVPSDGRQTSPRSPKVSAGDEALMSHDIVEEDDWWTRIPEHISDRYGSRPSNL